MREPQTGDRFGSFELVEELGRGGMGIVFRARDLSLGRAVALKILMPGLASDEQFVRRFQREAQTVAALNHPNIVGVLSCGEQDGVHYFAMQYIVGRDLGKILAERLTLPVDEALSITAQIAGALDQASSRGIVHRDIKPSNIYARAVPVGRLGPVKRGDLIRERMELPPVAASAPAETEGQVDDVDVEAEVETAEDVEARAEE